MGLIFYYIHNTNKLSDIEFVCNCDYTCEWLGCILHPAVHQDDVSAQMP